MSSLPSYVRSISSLVKRVRLEPTTSEAHLSWRVHTSRWACVQDQRHFSSGRRPQAQSQSQAPDTLTSSTTTQSPSSSKEHLSQGLNEPRLPRSVQAAYLRPLRRQAKYGVPACDLQLRSFSVRNLELMTDFALRAAYYLNIPASGPVPLPRLVERWTVSRSTFAHKKSQENFERITMRRLIQLQDAHSEAVQTWLAFIRKHAYYGVGMKANVWEHEKLGVGKQLDVKLENLKQVTDPKWAHFGRRKTPQTAEQVMDLMRSNELRSIKDAPAQDRS